MKQIILFLTAVISLFSSDIFAQHEHKDEKFEVKPNISADGNTYYGEDIKSDVEKVQIKDLFAEPEKYKGKNITIEGSVTGVCQNMGCWLMLSDGEKEVRVMTQHKFFMPKDLGTVRSAAQGEFGVKEITEEQAKDFAKEMGKTGDDIKGPQMMYFIKTTGVKILK